MFSGIIQEVGTVKKVKSSSQITKLTVFAPEIANKLKIGGSVAINGVCQTVTRKENGFFLVDAVLETVNATTIKYLQTGQKVNLETAATYGQDISGHFITGHVDNIGTIKQIRDLSDSKLFYIEIPQSLVKYAAQKGSIAIDGISLTIADYHNNLVKTAIIPHTIKNTTLSDKKIGSRLNIEMDILAKYALCSKKVHTSIDYKMLSENGFI